MKYQEHREVDFVVDSYLPVGFRVDIAKGVDHPYVKSEWETIREKHYFYRIPTKWKLYVLKNKFTGRLQKLRYAENSRLTRP